MVHVTSQLVGVLLGSDLVFDQNCRALIDCAKDVDIGNLPLHIYAGEFGGHSAVRLGVDQFEQANASLMHSFVMVPALGPGPRQQPA